MVARTLILFTLTALILIAFVWLAPLDVMLKARGYSPEQITAMKTAAEPQPGPPCPAGENNSPTTGTDTQTSPENTQAGRRESQPAEPENTDTNTVAKAEETGNAAPPPRKFVSTATINVRAGQGTDTDVVGQLEPRTVVTVVEEPSGKWMKIKTDSVTGWVYKPLFEPQGD